MKWDSSRPVDWADIARHWVISVVLIVVVYAIMNQGVDTRFLIVAASSLPVFLLIGYVLAKLGLERKPPRSAKVVEVETVDGPRPKPAPTKRTGGGTPSRKPKRKR